MTRVVNRTQAIRVHTERVYTALMWFFPHRKGGSRTGNRPQAMVFYSTIAPLFALETSFA